jgi:hypothetical protein
VAVLGPGKFFGEEALLTSSPRNAHVIAKESMLLYYLDKHDLRTVFDEFPGLEEIVREEAGARRRGHIQQLEAAAARPKLEALAMSGPELEAKVTTLRQAVSGGDFSPQLLRQLADAEEVWQARKDKDAADQERAEVDKKQAAGGRKAAKPGRKRRSSVMELYGMVTTGEAEQGVQLAELAEEGHEEGEPPAGGRA